MHYPSWCQELLIFEILKILKGIINKEPSKGRPLFVLHLITTNNFSAHHIS